MKSQNVLILVLSLMLISCSGSKNDQGPLNKNGDPIISDQYKDDEVIFPGQTPLFVALIKLNTPALLSTAKRSADGAYQVDPQLKQTILDEQAQFEKDLLAISPEIKILFKYRMVLNAIAVQAPQALVEDINKLEFALIEAEERFSLPKVLQDQNAAVNSIFTNNSMTFIGAEEVQNKLFSIDKNGQKIPVRGQGIKIGIIDSGIDYTHSMLGGTGDTSIFKSIDPEKMSAHFPNKKVVGGFDFAGKNFDTRSHLYVNRLPVPDQNPLDQGGHGTHVAGTVAGIGDGENTYNGAAPDAMLYALKVFGDIGGATSDTVVIAALEFAADPNKDLSPDDKLDVVNLSLGGSFGKPHNLYNQAIGNLVRGGVVTVAAAGNSGAINSIVGAPSTADDAISVAASIDDMDHNWKFSAVEFKTSQVPMLLVEAVEGVITKAIAATGQVSGKLVEIGLAAVDLTQDQKDALKGNVALIDRGDVPFDAKIKRAEDAGAIGVVMVNNQEGPAIQMGGNGTYLIPGVMITQALGNILKKDMKLGDATIDFVGSQQILKPELIDTLTGFSSQGPRDLDSAIKPEITAPGFNILSARMGSGVGGAKMGGTSMSSPHVAGVAALLVQYKSHLSAKQIKSAIMNSGKLISDEAGVIYPISRQGAGRIQAFEAAKTDLIFSEPGISLGKINIAKETTVVRKIEITNASDATVNYSLSAENHSNMTISLSQDQLTLTAGESVTVEVQALMSAPAEEIVELDAFIKVLNGQSVVGYIPVLAVVNKTTMMSVESLIVESQSAANSAGVKVIAIISNGGAHDGLALLFNDLGKDDRKDGSGDPFLSVACDLESAGYRLIEVAGETTLQVAAKLYNPVTTWGACDLNVEIDVDGDGVADKEIKGTSTRSLPGIDFPVAGLVSAVFDSKKLNTILEEYSKQLAMQPAKRPKLSFETAFQGVGLMIGFEHSTVAIVEASLQSLAIVSKNVKVRVSVSYNGGDVVDRDDGLGQGNGDWKSVSLDLKGGGFSNIPEIVTIAAGSKVNVNMIKGTKSNQNLLAYFPRNPFILQKTGADTQSQEVKAKYLEIVQP